MDEELGGGVTGVAAQWRQEGDVGQIDFGPSELLKSIQLEVRELTGFDNFKGAKRTLESVYAITHNLGGSLEGNTAETDVEWFARVIWEAQNHPEGYRWDNVQDFHREQFIGLARLTLENLPRIMSRMANRCKYMADAAKIAIESSRAVETKRKED